MTREIEETVARILRLFAERGHSAYGHEAVSQQEHALQAAALARAEGASAPLITAALLHDIGHLLHDLPDSAPDQGVDDRHEELAASWLARSFCADVVEPVRLHVAAKRYLCAVDPTYRDQLSPPSVQSLELQGGPMSEEEVRQFRQSAHHTDAVALRRWDDAAKDPSLVVPGIEAYAAIIAEALAQRGAVQDAFGQRSQDPHHKITART
jgi:phosphonate degradation associated HDIG domain protein